MKNFMICLGVAIALYLACVLACNVIHKPTLNWYPDGSGGACGSCWRLGIK